MRDAKIYQIFEGTAQVQRLVIARMQRQDYADRLRAAAEVLEQAPGAPTGNGAGASGDVMGDAVKAVTAA
jgi:hypothetical protein